MCLPGWYTRFTKPNRSPRNYGLCREPLMPFHTKRINRSTPTESVHSSDDTSIKPIITRSFRFITEKVSIFAKIKQALMKSILTFITSNFSSVPTTSSRESIHGGQPSESSPAKQNAICLQPGRNTFTGCL